MNKFVRLFTCKGAITKKKQENTSGYERGGEKEGETYYLAAWGNVHPPQHGRTTKADVPLRKDEIDDGGGMVRQNITSQYN